MSPEPDSAGAGGLGIRKVHNRFSNFESYDNSIHEEPSSAVAAMQRTDGHSDPQPPRVAARRQPPQISVRKRAQKDAHSMQATAKSSRAPDDVLQNTVAQARRAGKPGVVGRLQGAPQKLM